jgi:atlastin
MDTQGTFDSNSTVFENAFIFALTLLVSSVTVYNIMHNLQEDNLQHLSFFAEYGVLAIDAYHTSPFQVCNFENKIKTCSDRFLAINISCT